MLEETQISFKDTEHQGDEGQQGHPHSYVTYPVFLLGLGQSVGQSRLKAHKQHAGGEGDPSSHVVKDFSKIHLKKKKTKQADKQKLLH